MFIDEVLIKIAAGNGGNGCTSFRHEKYVEFGGPDGGNGGKGGNIVFVAEKGLKTLIDLRYKKTIKADSGEAGSGNNKFGASAEDTIIKVPIGTTVRDNSTSLIICDLIKDGQFAVVAKGGRGGKGNSAFKSNRNKAPNTSENGEPGEEKILKCDLNLLADACLIGFPNAGKSSIISIISASKPKIASYPFTTLTPNLGVVKNGDYSFVVADLPGLIEGASEGVGLGIKFLKHASRCKIIVHVLDMSGYLRNPVDDYKVIREELKKYSKKLYDKPEIVIANKMDINTAEETLKLFKEAYPNINVICMSAATKEGINDAINAITKELIKYEEVEVYDKEEMEEYVLYEFKNEIPYIINKVKGTWIVSGEKLEKMFRMTKFNSDEAEINFAYKLKKMGVDAELKRLGAVEGDTIRILDKEFTYEEGLF
ncbi:MAG: GTPase ObgE [Bacilli bacterium]